MLLIRFLVLSFHRFSNSQYLVRTLLLLITALHLYRGDDEKWEIQYQPQRIYTKGPEQMRWQIDQNILIRYNIYDASDDSSSIEIATCLPIWDYHIDTVGYAVCNTFPSYPNVEKLVRDTVANNITNIFVNWYTLSSPDMRQMRFQCIRFIVQIMDQRGDVRVSNLTNTPCPGLTFASLLYWRPNLYMVRIDGLPLQQDPRNVTLACPMPSNLKQVNLLNNGLTNTPFSTCPAYFSNLQDALLINQQLTLNDIPMFTSSDGLIYLALHRCSLHNLPRSTFAGLNRLQILNISDNYISSFQKGVFHDLSNLIVLRLDNNVLTNLDMSVFQRLSSLKYLFLTRNYLNLIDGEVAILPSLCVIDLSHNNLTVVRKNSFRNSAMLAVIDLGYNRISNIESGAFFNMTSFRFLVAFKNVLTYVNPCSWFSAFNNIGGLILAYNNITDVEGLQCLSQMQILNLFHNELSTIPPLGNCIKLESLDLGHNAIHYISGDEITPATRLIELSLDGNEMLGLGAFSNLRSVKSLDLNVNNLTYIPKMSFNGLQSLETLNLSYNHIKYVGAFAFPENLQNLGLYGNELTYLDSSNQNLSKLHTLIIGHNNLTKFNMHLPNIVYFDISENPLLNFSLQLCKMMPRLQDIFLEKLGIGHNGTVDRDLFGEISCSKWRHVSLARNLISKIDKHLMLHGVTGGVDFSHNPLQSIPMYPYEGFYQTYLYFNNCSIKGIAPMAFQYMTYLEYVELRGNDIRYFPQMSQMNGIVYDLRNNPIVCSCHLRWLHGHPTRRKYLFTKCMDPITGSDEIFDLLSQDRLLCQNELSCTQECLCFGVNISTITIVKCSSRSLSTIPLSLPPEADIIYLDHNKFRKPRFPGDNAKMAASQLFLHDSEINVLEQDLFATFPSLQMIDLSNNDLEVLNMDVFRNQRELKKLFLHGNHIYQIYNGAAGYDLPYLQVITLHVNNLHAVPESLDIAIRSITFTNLTLAWNPWECTACAGPILRKWLAQHAAIVSDAANIRCNKTHLPVLDINTTSLGYAKCVNAIHTLTNTRWGITAGLTVSLVLLLISLVLLYFFRHHRLVLLYNNFDFLKRRRQELDVLYDVRIIYDETDERVRQWVVGELLQVLEAEWGLNVFLVERDMLAGGNHAEEIARSIRQSKRTLILVSQNVVENEWAQFAYQAAFQFQIENELHRVLVVAWEPVEIDPLEHSIKVYFETKQVMRRTSRRFWPILKSKLPIGRENIGQNPDNIQLNLLHHS